MSIIGSYIMTNIEFLFYFIVSTNLVGIKKKGKIAYFYMFIMSIFIAVSGKVLPDWIVNIVSILIVIVLIQLLFELKFQKTIYVYFVTSILIIISQFLSLLPMILINSNLEKSFLVAIMSQLSTLGLLMLILKIFPIKYLKYFIEYKNKLFDTLMLGIFIVLIIFVILWNGNLNIFKDHYSILMIISFFTIMINIIIMNNGFKNQKIHNELKINLQYMPIVEKLMDDIKGRQHEHNNHMQAIHMFILAEDNIELIRKEITQYIDDYHSQIDFEEFLKLENKLLSGFLYSKKMKADEHKIKMVIKVSTSHLNTNISNYTWIEMIGILLDNAIESTDNGARVEVIVESNDQYSVITVKNSHKYVDQNSLRSFLGKGYSTKEKSRGYGLARLQQLINSLNGELEFYNEKRPENFVVFKIVIPSY